MGHGTDDEIRARLLRACLEEVALRGFHATTVGQVTAAAHRTRQDFYERFQSKAECFAETLAQADAELLDAVTGALEAAPGPVLRTVVGVTLRHLAADLAATRCLVLERLQAELLLDADEARRQTNRIEALAHLSGADDPFAVRAFVAAFEGIVRDEVLAGRGPLLAELETPLMVLACRLGIGAEPSAAAGPDHRPG